MLKILTFLSTQSEKRPWLVVLVILLVTVFLLAGIPRLQTELSQEAMMPQGYESIQALKDVNDIFGGVSYETVLVTAENVADPKVVKALWEISPEGMMEAGFKEGEVLGVETYLDFLKYKLPEILKAAGMYVPVDLAAVDDAVIAQFMDFYLDPDANSPFLDMMASFAGAGFSTEMKSRFVEVFKANSDHIKDSSIKGEDGIYTSTLIRFQVDPDLNEKDQVDLGKRFRDYLPGLFEGIEGIRTYTYGNASMQMEAEEFMQKETRKLMAVALLYIMLILYLTFRRVSDIGLPLLIILVAIFWLVGLMGWVGITYSTMSVAVMPLMMGINIAYVIHILSRYYEEREEGLSVDLSATTSIKTVGIAVFLTAITTVFGFSSFMITDIPPMRDFGLLCMLGIAFSFFLSLTLLPAIVVIRDRRKGEEKLASHLEKMRARRRDARYGMFIDRLLVRMAMVAERHHWIVAVTTTVLLAFALFSLFNVKTGADIRKMMPKNMPSMEAQENITEIFGPQQSDIILVEALRGGNIYQPENLAALLAMEDAVVADTRNDPESENFFQRGNISSIADYILAETPNGRLPQTLQGVEEIVAGLEQRMPLASLVKEEGEGSAGVATVAMVMLNSGFSGKEEEFIVKRDIMRNHAAEASGETGMRLRATGISVLIADLLDNIVPTQVKTSGLALLLCVLVLVAVFRSLAYGIITLVVVVCGIVAELVFLYVVGWPLDIMTVMVASLVIGAGIDFGIHVTHRFREELHASRLSLEDAIGETVKNGGRALVAAALTTAGVFAILGVSNMGIMQRFGWTTTVGLMGALFGAVLVLPSVLAIVAKRRRE